MNFFLVFCKSRKKFDKYVKINRIRNKCVIDIKKMMAEEGVCADRPSNLEYFKVLVFQKMQLAASKNKEIYYIPNFDTEIPVEKLLRIKGMFAHHKFNLLFFFQEFSEDTITQDRVMAVLNEFDASQVIEDY